MPQIDQHGYYASVLQPDKTSFSWKSAFQLPAGRQHHLSSMPPSKLRSWPNLRHSLQNTGRSYSNLKKFVALDRLSAFVKVPIAASQLPTVSAATPTLAMNTL
jgi:hypothetical protein